MIGDVKARVIRSDGRELTLGDGDWRIPSDGLENWANLPYSVALTEIPVTDGGMVLSKRVSSVDRTITAIANGKYPDRLRAEAIAFFNPKFSYEVEMTYMGRTRKCSGEQAGFKASEHNIYKKPEITWTILCADPYLTEADGLSVSMDRTLGRFGFPWHSQISQVTEVMEGSFGFPWYSLLPNDDLPSGAVFGKYVTKNVGPSDMLRDGFIVGVHETIDSINVSADGDVASGVRFVARVSNGSVLNPTLRIGYAYARMNAKLKSKDVLVIDTTQLPPVVEVNGKNAAHLLDRRSDLMGLKIGSDATVTYDADEGQENMSVEFSYRNRYLGV